MPVSRTASPATVMPPSARTAAFAAAGFSPHCDPGSGRGYARAKVVPPSSETKAVAGGRERGDPGPRQRLAQAVVDCDELSPHARRVDRLALVEGDHGHERCVVAAGVAVARSDRLIRFAALSPGQKTPDSMRRWRARRGNARDREDQPRDDNCGLVGEHPTGHGCREDLLIGCLITTDGRRRKGHLVSRKRVRFATPKARAAPHPSSPGSRRSRPSWQPPCRRRGAGALGGPSGAPRPSA
jgi:hypothetical protein